MSKEKDIKIMNDYWNDYAVMVMNEKNNKDLYKPGFFLYQLDELYERKKDAHRVFIYTGQLNADGWGVLIGFDSDGKLRKSTGYNNFQYGGDVRIATQEEVEEFIWAVFNYQDPIREYGRP